MNIDGYLLSQILGFLFKYDYKNKEYVNYLLVSKKWIQAINDIKCKICKNGIYLLARTTTFKCNNCWHVLEPKYKKKERRKKFIYFYSLNNNTKLLSYTNKLKNLL